MIKVCNIFYTGYKCFHYAGPPQLWHTVFKDILLGYKTKVGGRVMQTTDTNDGSLLNAGGSFCLRRNVSERKAPVLFLYNSQSSVSDFSLTFFNMQR